ncbi:MAG: alpha/beta hydrolase family protein [Candidatus Dormibacteria bacterium]
MKSGAVVTWLGLLAVLALPTALTATSAAAPATPCVAIAAAEPQTGHSMPPAGPVLFAADFPRLYDCEWGYQLGGWGGIKQASQIKHTPVISVHGNQADAENWYLVRDYFIANAGYTDQEMYAISYNGLGNASAGLPDCCQPAPESTTYWQGTNPPFEAVCCNGGHGASDEPNVADLYAFVRAVQQYTGSTRVDIVAHSLGVTVARRMLVVHPELRPDVLAFVSIAGANHGTTACTGLAASYYGCDEIAPGTPWLAALNAAGEAPGPTKWMSIYAGDNSDVFFQNTVVGDDRQSPHLKGAVNVTFPGGLPAGTLGYHNTERVRPDIVATYLKFLLEFGQAPVVAATVQPPPGVLSLPNTSP